MKKILILGITGFIALGIAGCGGSDAKNQQAEKEAVKMDSVATELETTIEEVESKRKEADAALDDLLKEFETETEE